VGWFFVRAPYPDEVPTIGDEMTLEARPVAVTERDRTGAVSIVEANQTIPSYGVEVVDGEVVVTIRDGDPSGSRDE
jgi:hypothetical protein